MFNGKKRGDAAIVGLPPAMPRPSGEPVKRRTFSVIGSDVVITGNISATADLHIDGRVEGDVTCCSLIQGSESRVNGSVKAETARLAGAIQGTVSVRQLTVERAARMTGEIEYETITMENGASIDGQLKRVAPIAVRSAPVLSAVRNPDEAMTS